MRKWLGNLFLTWGFHLLGIGAPTVFETRPRDDDDADMPGMFSFNLPPLVELHSEDIIEAEPTTIHPEGSVEARLQIALNSRRREF